jgi:hypothetical protein
MWLFGDWVIVRRVIVCKTGCRLSRLLGVGRRFGYVIAGRLFGYVFDLSDIVIFAHHKSVLLLCRVSLFCRNQQ